MANTTPERDINLREADKKIGDQFTESNKYPREDTPAQPTPKEGDVNPKVEEFDAVGKQDYGDYTMGGEKIQEALTVRTVRMDKMKLLRDCMGGS